MTGKRPSRPESRKTAPPQRQTASKTAEQIFEILPDLIFRLDAQGVFLEFMGGRQAELYKAPEEFLGKPIGQVLPQEVADFLVPRIQRVLKSGKPAVVDYLLPMKDGPQRFEARLVPSGRGDVLALVRSVSRTRPVETMLREIEGRYHALVELSPNPIALHDGRTILYVNRAAAELLVGGDRDQALGRPVEDFVHPDSRPEVARRIRAMLRHRRPMPLIEEKFLRSDGSVVEVEVTASSFKEGDRTLIQVIFRDISRRKAAEAALARLNRLNLFLSGVNQAIVRTSDREALFREICHIAVERGGMQAACVGLWDPNGQHLLPVVAWEGKGECPESRGIALEAGLGARALRRGRVIGADAMAADPALEGWRAAAVERGYHSAAIVPVRCRGKVMGALTLYASEPGFFGDQEEALLDVLADDLEFALDALEQDALRRAMERALAQSEENFRGLFEHIKDGVFIASWEGQVLSCNAAALHLFGYRLEEVESLAVDRLFADPSDLDRFRAVLEREGAVSHLEVRLLRKDGSVLDVLLSASLQRGPQGEKKGYQGIIHDITERKRVETALRESEEKMRALNENLAEGMVYQINSGPCGRDRRFSYISPAVERLHGLAVEAVLQNPLLLYQQVLEEDRERLQCAEEAALASRTMMNADVQIRLPSGQVRWRRFISTPRVLPNGDIVWDGIEFDITEHKRSVLALRDSEEKYRTLVESARDAIFLADAETGFIVEVNRQAERLTGLAAADLVGRHHSLLHPPAERDHYRRIFTEHAQGRNLIARDLLVRRADGTDVPVDISATVVEIGGRRFIQGVFQDISDRKWAERTLQESMEMLQRGMQGTILAMVTMVEMRDPFTAGHQSRVARLACAIGRALGMNEHQVEGLRVAGLLHDIGKIGVPAEILSKPGRILDFEYNIIKSHPEIGYKILREIDFPWAIADMVLHHHERLDGSGYPSGLKDGEILPEARILVVADVVEAMASHRPYRPARGIEKALEEVAEHRGRLYDPVVVDACLALFRDHQFVLD